PRPGDDDRGDPDRLHLLAGAARLVRGRLRPRRPAHRLRQASPRGLARRLDRAEGGDRTRRRAPHRAAHDLRRSGADRGSRGCCGGRRGGDAVDVPWHGELPDRGARARRPFVQLPEAGGHRDDRRPHVEVGERARGDPELRSQVDRGSARDARRARAHPQGRGPPAVAMRYARSGKKLGRDSAHRKALYSNLAGAVITHGRIETTEAKAKAVKPFAEKMITLGKRGDLHARRLAMAELRSNDVVHKLFLDVAPRFAERNGGSTRVIKLGPRQGDAASMALL